MSMPIKQCSCPLRAGPLGAISDPPAIPKDRPLKAQDLKRKFSYLDRPLALAKSPRLTNLEPRDFFARDL